VLGFAVFLQKPDSEGSKMSTNRKFPAYGGVVGQRHVAGGYVAAKVGPGALIGAVVRCRYYVRKCFDQNVSVRGKCLGRPASVWRTLGQGEVNVW